jgi:Lar family restriction alleviation protein
MKKVELLDCPFCGGQADIALYTHNKISNGVAIRCTCCGGSTEHIVYRHDDIEFPAVIKRMKDSQAEAAKLWNKRFELK